MATRYLNFDAATDGAGTIGSPWKSFDTAQAGVARGDTVIVSGTLRDNMVFLPAKGGASISTRTKWIGANDNPFTVTAGEPLTGWVQCSAADQATVGANFALFWKATITKSSLPGSDPYAANICEAGAQIPICVSREITTDKFFVTDPAGYWTADVTGLSGANIINFQKAAVFDLFTQAQLEACQVNFVASPNVPAKSAVASYNTGTKVLTLATPAAYENNPNKDDFALFNLLPAMKRGEWGFKDNGTTVTIFCYPQNVANLSGQITYSARNYCIDINGTSNVEIGFFRATQPAGGNGASGCIVNNGAECSGVYLHHFEASDMLDTGGALAVVDISAVDDLLMHDFDITRGQGLFGLYLHGSGDSNATAGNPGLVNTMQRASVYRWTCSFTSSAPLRMFTVANSAIQDCIFWETGKQSHGNTMNCYQSCHNNLWKNCDGIDAGGFVTWQKTDSLVVMCCTASASHAEFGGARAFYQQQGAFNSQGSVYGYKPAMFFNNFAVSWGAGDRLGFTNGNRIGAGAVPNDRWTVLNNIYHGHSAMTVADFATVDLWDRNINTSGAAYGPNDSARTVTEEYVNAALDNFAFKPTALARTKPGQDMTAYIAALAIRFPMVANWNTDCVGDAINWAAPGVGATVNKDAVFGKARNITYSGITGGSTGGGGEPTRPLFAPGFKIKVAA